MFKKVTGFAAAALTVIFSCSTIRCFGLEVQKNESEFLKIEEAQKGKEELEREEKTEETQKDKEELIEEDKKIITKVIFVPGTYCSALFYTEKGSRIYRQGEAVWLSDSLKKGSKFVLYGYKLMALDEKGHHKYPIAVANKSNDIQFSSLADKKIAEHGVMCWCEKINTSISGAIPEVRYMMFNYDWTSDILENGTKLADEIGKHERVILIGYSQGGLVSAAAIAELKNRNKLGSVVKFISIGTPFNGLCSFLNMETVSMSNDKHMSVDLFMKIYSGFTQEFCKNCPSFYQMMPTKEYGKRTSSICDAKMRKLTHEGAREKLRFRQFFDGRGDFFDRADKVHEKLFDENGKYILSNVDCEFICGKGFETVGCVKLNSEKQGDMTVLKLVDGDGTVPFKQSAIPPMEVKEENLHIFYTIHMNLVNDIKVIEKVISIIKEIEAKKTEAKAYEANSEVVDAMDTEINFDEITETDSGKILKADVDAEEMDFNLQESYDIDFDEIAA